LVSFTDVLDDVVPPLLESGILHKIAVKESVITDEKEVKSTDRSGSKQIAAQQIGPEPPPKYGPDPMGNYLTQAIPTTRGGHPSPISTCQDTTRP